MTRAELLKIAKPIMFNTEMVTAILEGRKTVTRRVLKKPFIVHSNGYITKPRGNENLCPYFPPYNRGSYMYVRETWSEWTDGYVYKAWSSTFPQPGKASVMKWHPSLHMPKEAARIFLKVKDVRVERLQDITEEQALAEGVPDDWPMNEIYCPKCHGEGLVGTVGPSLGFMEVDCRYCEKATNRFSNLWNSTIKREDIETYGWDANPFVWVIEFEWIEPDCEV